MIHLRSFPLNRKGVTSLVVAVLGLVGVISGDDLVSGTGGEEGVGGAYDGVATAAGYIALVIAQVLAAFNRTKAGE